MSVEPNDYMKRRAEQTSLVQVGFEPSRKLNDAMHRFLLDKFQHEHIIFRSYDELDLPVYTGDSDGLHYDVIDEKELNEYDKRLRLLGGMPIAILQARTVMVERGNLHVDLQIAPTREQRRQLGGVVLRHFDIYSNKPLSVYAKLSRETTRSQDDVRNAAVALRKVFANRHEEAESDAYYVTRPHVLVQPVSQPKP